MPDAPLWSWCARCQFPGREPFLFGTVFTERGEGEERALALLLELLGRHLPTLPEIVAVIPGAVVFCGR